MWENMAPVDIGGLPFQAWAQSRPRQEERSAVQRCVQMVDDRQLGDLLQCVSVPKLQRASCCPPEKHQQGNVSCPGIDTSV